RWISATAVPTAGPRLAVVEKCLQVLLETDYLGKQAVVGGDSRIDHSIEGQGTDAVGKEVRVPLADVSAIRKAEIGQLVVSDGDPDLVHVVRRAARVHEGQQVAAALLASICKVLIRLERRLLLLGIVEHAAEGPGSVRL